jgi:hypothetical protein
MTQTKKVVAPHHGSHHHYQLSDSENTTAHRCAWCRAQLVRPDSRAIGVCLACSLTEAVPA